jgi:heme-degrading monooxygenase HmoA
MHVRLSRFAGLPPERIDATIEEFREQQLPELEEQAGFKGVVVMLNRGTGQAAALTFWETEADRRAQRSAART